MWGRSLYQNIQRFLLFQMTVNVVACLIVLIGAFLGTQSTAHRYPDVVGEPHHGYLCRAWRWLRCHQVSG